MRRPLLLFSGLLTNGLLICLFVSGFWVAYNGHAEAMTWVPNLHSVSAIISIGLIVAHVAFHVLQKKKEKSAETFKTLQKKQYKSFVIVSFSYFFILMLLTGIYQFVEPSTKQNDSELAKLINNYQYNYGAHPFRPSQTETTSGDFVNTNQIATSEQCGTCHTDIYKQWLSSTHRQAASDPAYVKNVSLLETNRGISATRYCEGCHAPIALLTGQLTPGGKHGGIPNTPAHNEGVGCMGCHGIANVVHTNGSASYTYDPKEFYLFDNSKNYFAISLRNFLIRLQPQQHRSAMSPDVLSDPKLCATCHEQFMDESMNDWGWVKMQSEYSNWLKSPFSGQNNQEFQHTANLRCQDCHFPLVDGTDPSADKNNQIRSHRSLGANTILPMLNGDTKQLEMTKKFLQNGKLRLDIEEPDRYDTVFNNQSIEQNRDQRQTDNTPYFLYLGEEAKIRITVTNQMVGHSFPAGTTDLNQAWVNFKVTDIDNRPCL